MILVCGSYILLPAIFGQLDIRLFLYIQLFCTTLAIFIAFLILFWHKIRFSFAKQKVFNWQQLKSVLPFALIVLLMSAHYRLDGFLLERLHPDGPAQAGIYAMAYRLLDAANMIGFLVASFLLPFIARHFSTGVSVTEVILNSRHLLMLFSISIAMAAFYLAPWIQQLLYHTTDRSTASVLQFCIPALIGYSMVQVYGTVLTATGYIMTFCKIVLTSLLLNLIINIWLIPGQGAQACCYAAMASQWFCGVATLLLVKQKTGIPIDNKSILLYLFLALLLALGYWLGKMAGMPPAALLAGSIILTFILSFITGLFSCKQWKNYLLPKQ
jgi:O-antigen/teichoic acid export membrane protein